MLFFSKTARCAAAIAVLYVAPVYSQTAPPPSVVGRWEVLRYSEQGVQVDKKQPALRQAVAVYDHVRKQRSRTWYGYFDPTEAGRRARRDFEMWEQRDSAQEVERIAEAIEMPYFAVFFADSTLALYNKEAATSRIFFPESRRYVFSPATQSLDVVPGSNGWSKSDIQVLELTETRMLLFIPDEAEVVELIKTPFILP